jgi:hypothetical protein
MANCEGLYLWNCSSRLVLLQPLCYNSHHDDDWVRLLGREFALSKLFPMMTDPVARLFWDADTGALDLERHRRAIIARVLNYGTLRDWQWLTEQYGEEAVRAEALAPGRTSIRRRTRRLVSLLFA